jgi:GNAT superfamily N-acetyltransferase
MRTGRWSASSPAWKCRVSTEAMAVEIKLARSDEAELIHKIIQSAFAEYKGKLPVPPGALYETVNEARRAIEEGRVVLAWDGDTAIGTARYELRPDCLYVGRVAVLPSHQRRGVGAALMAYMERLAPTLGRTTIRLGTRQSMRSNLSFYKRLGYHVSSTERHSRGPDTIVWFVKAISS